MSVIMTLDLMIEHVRQLNVSGLMDGTQRKHLLVQTGQLLALLEGGCPHCMNTPTADLELVSCGAWCTICGKNFGWYCPDSPDHTCYYDIIVKDSVRGIELINGEFHPASEYGLGDEDGGEEWCIFCGHPDERK